MRPFVLIALLFAFLFQTMALPLYAIGPAAPDFILLLVSYAALHERPRRSLILALVAGGLADAISIDPWGAHVLAYSAAAWVLMGPSAQSWSGSALPRALLALVAAAAAAAARAGLLWALREPPALYGPFPLGSSVAYQGILSLVAFGLLDHFRPRLLSPVYRRLQ